MTGRVERQPTGWYDAERERYVPMLLDIYRSDGFVAAFRDIMKRIENLERRG